MKFSMISAVVCLLASASSVQAMYEEYQGKYPENVNACIGPDDKTLGDICGEISSEQAVSSQENISIGLFCKRMFDAGLGPMLHARDKYMTLLAYTNNAEKQFEREMEARELIVHDQQWTKVMKYHCLPGGGSPVCGQKALTLLKEEKVGPMFQCTTDIVGNPARLIVGSWKRVPPSRIIQEYLETGGIPACNGRFYPVSRVVRSKHVESKIMAQLN